MKGTRPLDNDEIRQVSACFTGTFETRNRGLFMLGVSTGGRISELLSLTIGDDSLNYAISSFGIGVWDWSLGLEFGITSGYLGEWIPKAPTMWLDSESSTESVAKEKSMDLAILAIFTLISACAHRGACIIVYCAKTGTPVLYAPGWITTLGGFLFVKAYMYLATPIACLNGFLMYGDQGLIIAGLGSFLGMHILRFLNRGGLLMPYGAITLIWTVVNIFKFVF